MKRPAFTVLVASIAIVVATAIPIARQAATAASQSAAPTVDSVINTLSFRNIGPFRTAAWITAIAVPETPVHDHLYTIYAATRSGGLWKTTNAGTTWAPISDAVGAAAVGAIALAPSDPRIVWMGTGEQAVARAS